MDDITELIPWSDRPVWRGISCGPGWNQLILALTYSLIAVYPDVKVVQIKEKFGTLRYYIDPPPVEHYGVLYEIIGDYERLSALTCELCGAKTDAGTRRFRGGWIRTLCDDCFENASREYNV